MKRDKIYLFFAVNYFAQGMGGLAYEPVSYYLKDALGLGPAQAAVFVAWMTLPLTIKPLFGVLTDFLPWAGKRRAPHLVAVSVLTSLGWLLLAGLKGPSYPAALALLILVNVGFVLSDVVCDGVMVERGKERGKTGLYQAVSIGTLYGTLIVTGFGGGWLAQHAPYRWVFVLTACFPMLTALSAGWIDEAGVGDVKETAARGWRGLSGMFRDPKAWAVALGIFLWSFCPFLGTAQFYYQSEALGLSPIFIGGLATAGGLAGMAGAALFGRMTAGGTAKVGLARRAAVFALSVLPRAAVHRDPDALVQPDGCRVPAGVDGPRGEGLPRGGGGHRVRGLHGGVQHRGVGVEHSRRLAVREAGRLPRRLRGDGAAVLDRHRRHFGGVALPALRAKGRRGARLGS